MCRATSSELSSAGLNLYKFMVASLHIEDVQAQLAAVRTEIDAVLMRVDAAAAAVDSLQAQLDTCNAAIAAGSQDGELAAHRAFLRQDMARAGSREDRLRMHHQQLMEKELRLTDAKLKLQLGGTPAPDVENPRAAPTAQLDELPTLTLDALEYHGPIRVLPVIGVLLFLASSMSFFGWSLLHSNPDLSLTQKVASMSSAALAILSFATLLVRAAMCTAEWRWGFSLLYQWTGWQCLQPQYRLRPSPFKTSPQAAGPQTPPQAGSPRVDTTPTASERLDSPRAAEKDAADDKKED